MAENNYRIGILLSLHDKMTVALARIDGQARKVEATTKRLHKAAISPAVKINDHISQPLKTIEGKILNLGKTVEMSLGAGAGKTIFSAGMLGYYNSKKLVAIAADEVTEKQKVKSQDTTRKSLDKLAAAANSASNNLKSTASIETPLKATKYAAGGILTRPHLGLVGEAGPEAIIPLSAGRRSSAINLWQQAGQMLGVPMHAAGGIVGMRKIAGATIGSNIAGQLLSDKITEQQYDKVSGTITVTALTGNILTDLQEHGALDKIAVKYADSKLAKQVRRVRGVSYGEVGHFLKVSNTLSKVARLAGRAAPFLNLASESYDIYKAKDKKKAIFQSLSGLAVGLAGAEAGALIGQALIPIPVVGAIIGATIGGAIGNAIGKKYAGQAYDEATKPTSGGQEKKQKLDYKTINKHIFKQMGIKSDAEGEAFIYRNFRPHASGGLLTRPHLGLVAEAGPEVIIPLSSRMRSRSLELWQETGKRLGIKPYADGGFAGLINNTSAAPDAAPIRGKGQGGNINVTITGMEVNMTNDVDEDELALKIGRKILRSVKQAAENKAS